MIRSQSIQTEFVPLTIEVLLWPLNIFLWPIKKALTWVLSNLIGGFIRLIEWLFSGEITAELLGVSNGWENPANASVMPGLNTLYEDMVVIFFVLLPIMILMTVIARMFFPTSDRITYTRLASKMMAGVLLVVAGEHVWFVIFELYHEVARVVWEAGGGPGMNMDLGWFRNGFVAGIQDSALGIGAIVVVLLFFIYFGTSILVTLLIFWVVLGIRLVIINTVFVLHPLLVALWIPIGGLGRYTNQIAQSIASVGALMLGLGIVIAGVLSVGGVIAGSPGGVGVEEGNASTASPGPGSPIGGPQDTGPDFEFEFGGQPDNSLPPSQQRELEAASLQDLFADTLAEFIFSMSAWLGTMWAVISGLVSVFGQALGGMGAGGGGSRSQSSSQGDDSDTDGSDSSTYRQKAITAGGRARNAFGSTIERAGGAFSATGQSQQNGQTSIQPGQTATQPSQASPSQGTGPSPSAGGATTLSQPPNGTSSGHNNGQTYSSNSSSSGTPNSSPSGNTSGSAPQSRSMSSDSTTQQPDTPASQNGASPEQPQPSDHDSSTHQPQSDRVSDDATHQPQSDRVSEDTTHQPQSIEQDTSATASQSQPTEHVSQARQDQSNGQNGSRTTSQSQPTEHASQARRDQSNGQNGSRTTSQSQPTEHASQARRDQSNGQNGSRTTSQSQPTEHASQARRRQSNGQADSETASQSRSTERNSHTRQQQSHQQTSSSPGSQTSSDDDLNAVERFGQSIQQASVTGAVAESRPVQWVEAQSDKSRQLHRSLKGARDDLPDPEEELTDTEVDLMPDNEVDAETRSDLLFDGLEDRHVQSLTQDAPEQVDSVEEFSWDDAVWEDEDGFEQTGVDNLNDDEFAADSLEELATEVRHDDHATAVKKKRDLLDVTDRLNEDEAPLRDSNGDVVSVLTSQDELDTVRRERITANLAEADVGDRDVAQAAGTDAEAVEELNTDQLAMLEKEANAGPHQKTTAETGYSYTAAAGDAITSGAQVYGETFLNTSGTDAWKTVLSKARKSEHLSGQYDLTDGSDT